MRLVEDNLMLRPTEAGFLEEAWVDVHEAGNAKDTLATLEDPLPLIDVLGTDSNLRAGENSLALTIKVRRKRPGLRIIYETGSEDPLARRVLLPRKQPFYKSFDLVALAAPVSTLAN